MIEKAKSVFLLMLVSASLYFTYLLWYGASPVEEVSEAVYERVVVENPRPLTETITPTQIVIKAETGYYGLQESNLDFKAFWAELSGLMQSSNLTALPEGLMLTNEAFGPCLYLHFKPYLPVGEGNPWFPALSANQAKSAVFNCSESEIRATIALNGIDEEIELSLSRESWEATETLISYFSPGQLPPLSILSEEDASLLLGKEVVLREPVFVPSTPHFMEELQLREEVLDRELILKTFFINPGLARVIEERDGGLLYTDGERGLRLIGQSLEYSNPLLEQRILDLTYTEALTGCSSYISYHGGWPSNLRLENIEVVSRGGSSVYQARWRMYFNGFPAYSYRPVSAAFNDRGLVTYVRSIYFIEPAEGAAPNLDLSDETGLEIPPPGVLIASWEEALAAGAALYDQLLGRDTLKVRLDALHPGYAVTGTGPDFRATPIWVVQLDGRRYLLRADSLTELQQEELR